ncbi:DUF1385 domain-containing protein [Diplocloster agilis]|uniref:DUF1385 domain-containing protein n=1 Tax=Diplocloster agilis TaxID=2850323 RepID=A0A949NHR2_9FIRM|nr:MULTISPECIES: DUF1385 domain-containing protein [Lachnospiraceae]MBU9736530.1 DUF1385 domain-containing protein [Diplocloster agilis]MCU6735022.1 DUF1385 domain-containing protein [Suonthocola fibrivorans]SCJ61812.1 Predicted metal-dependent enzyme [uncultured Clostridium sp.]
MKSSGIGGQAVIEGIMMKHGDEYSVAVRKPDGEIELQISNYEGVLKNSRIKKWPFIRGVFAFIDSLVLGMKTLTFSASFYEEEEEAQASKADQVMEKLFKDKAEKVVMGLAIVLSVVLAVGIFMVLPLLIAGYFKKYIISYTVLAIIEGAIRIILFISYVALISCMKDIKRVYMYHGAEHKCINCVEHGKELTVENVRSSSKQHKRCGTSFLLMVVIISVFFFMFIRVDSPVVRLLSRVLLVPLIAGVAYEFIRLAGNTDNKLIGILSKPGLWMQGLTTKEPDDSMIEVAITAVEAVFDWKAYLAEEFGAEQLGDKHDVSGSKDIRRKEAGAVTD